jgi:hypothetical protein
MFNGENFLLTCADRRLLEVPFAAVCIAVAVDLTLAQALKVAVAFILVDSAAEWFHRHAATVANRR